MQIFVHTLKLGVGQPRIAVFIPELRKDYNGNVKHLGKWGNALKYSSHERRLGNGPRHIADSPQTNSRKSIWLSPFSSNTRNNLRKSYLLIRDPVWARKNSLIDEFHWETTTQSSIPAVLRQLTNRSIADSGKYFLQLHNLLHRHWRSPMSRHLAGLAQVNSLGDSQCVT